jgi:hypothetical protein
MTSAKPEVLNSTGSYVKDGLSELEVENSRLQRLVVELLLQNQHLREALSFYRIDSDLTTRADGRIRTACDGLFCCFHDR